MNSIVYVGLDIGGTLAKVSMASEALSITPSTTIMIGENKLMLHLRIFEDILGCLGWVKQHIIEFEVAKMAVTGGGATRYEEAIKEIFCNTEIIHLNEYQSNIMGLSFLKEAALPLTFTQFVKQDQNNVDVTSKKVYLSECELPLQFISLGSGVNYHKIGMGKDGYERMKVDATTSYDGYLMDGTCLGGGYIFGLIRLLSEQAQPDKIIQLIKTSHVYSKIHEELMVNLMQTAISLSLIHQIPTILANGTILSIKPHFQEFSKAMLLVIHPLPFRRTLISLDAFEGYLGNLGLLYSIMPKINDEL